jgi:hypothetical protein
LSEFRIVTRHFRISQAVSRLAAASRFLCPASKTRNNSLACVADKSDGYRDPDKHRQKEITKMTTSNTANQESTQAMAPAREPELPKKANVGARKPQVAASKGPSGKKPTAAKKAAKGGNKATCARQGSKTAKVLNLLKRSGGATLKEIIKTTGWQAHSVRGFLSGTLGKKMKLTVTSTKAENKDRSYSVKA